MIRLVSVVVIAAALFFAIVMNIASKTDFSVKISRTMLVMAAVGGLLFYGYGYAVVIPNSVLAVIQTLITMCGMFVGKNDLSTISAAPGMQNTIVRICFWIVHFMALYATASAAITTIGAEALRHIRLSLLTKGDLVMIYGTTAEAVGFGRECSTHKKTAVVFISPKADAGALAAISQMGSVCFSDASALHAETSFLKKLGIRKGDRNIHIYCLNPDESVNYQYALTLKDAFEKADINPSQTTLVMEGEDETLVFRLQVLGDTYGFGFTSLYRLQDQAARLLIRKYPPCMTMQFDSNGRALHDFNCLIIGFGTYGQSVLKALINNGQFSGSHFRAFVMDPQLRKTEGFLHGQYSELFRQYDIELMEEDARSTEAFEFIRKNISTLNYIVVAIGNSKDNAEVSNQLRLFIKQCGKDIPVIRCSSAGLYMRSSGTETAERTELFSSESLDFQQSDLYAMALNHRYCSNPDHTMWDDWKECDPFSRLSSRASVDFIPAYLKMLGMTEEEMKKLKELKISNDSAETIDRIDIRKTENGESMGIVSRQMAENFGITEHERWSAFQLTNGFTAMDRTVWDQRAALYTEEREKTGKSHIRISKDMDSRLHACLIPWEDLDELSERENAVTGGHVDYKALDINNVLEMPQILNAIHM